MLRQFYHVAGLLYERENKATVQSWFQGMSSQLDDNASARLLRDEPLDVVGLQVIAAARAFALSASGGGGAVGLRRSGDGAEGWPHGDLMEEYRQ